MSANNPPLDQRLQFLKHKGRVIYSIDFSNCSAKDMLLLLDQIRLDITSQQRNSLLVLANFSGAAVDKNVATRMKEILVLDRPFVKKSAWVGVDSVPHVFYEHFKNFSRRDFPVFDRREDALEWLVQE